ncbi:MAG: cyclic nucleotide-binding protein [Gammaproteobacteria bacterium]|nr:cyclic nucleotide-binding protein [Gammaproteobacteria bacterium]
MEIEQIEILSFLQRHSPFKELSLQEQTLLATNIDVSYFKADSSILEYNAPLDAFYLIRSGLVETFRRSGALYNRLSEGGIFGEQGLLRGRKVRFPARAVEDTLIYLIPADVFESVFESNENFADYVEVGDIERRKGNAPDKSPPATAMTTRVRELVSQPPVLLAADATIHEAATLMRDQSVSCLLITAPDNSTQVIGLVTDRDLRNRVLAERVDLDTRIENVTSSELVTVPAAKYVFEAMLIMLRNNVHHLPVLDEGRPVGVIGIEDIIRHESNNSLYIVSSIFRQQSVNELAQLRTSVQSCFVRMVHEDANSQMIGSAMATIGRSFKQRLLELAEQELGPPPVPYCFIALGSMARDEQMIVTDQDNALILDDSYSPKQHDAYFKALAKFVCDGLDACGYPYCTGNIMATNPKWRQPLAVWKRYFTDWVTNPTAEKLLHCNIFFDIDAVRGETRFVDSLTADILQMTPKHRLFLASMTRNALQRSPPLGFFQDFVMEEDGQHKQSLNLKRRGTAPFTDLVRVLALSKGIADRNTYRRLNAISRANILPLGRAADFQDAFELIAMTRIKHQAANLQQNLEPDNNVLPERLSEFERKRLKAAFQVLANAQKFLKFHFQA